MSKRLNNNFAQFFLIFICTICLSLSLFASSDIQQSVAHRALSHKCSNNLDIAYNDCFEGISLLINLLDYHRDDERLSLVFYKSKFRDLLDSKKMTRYLKESLELIKIAESHRIHFNLWSFTEKFIQDHHLKIETNHFLAIMLQDNAKFYQVYWLESLDDKSSVLSLNSHLYNSWIRSLGYKQDYIGLISFYSPSLDHKLIYFNSKPYYYYMPWLMTYYLSQRSSTLSARGIPFFVSAIYKYHHHFKNYYSTLFRRVPATAKIDKLKELSLKDVQKGWEYRYKDLYMAYLGSAHALKDDEEKCFEDFRFDFAVAPVTLFKKILKEFKEVSIVRRK